MRVAVASSGDNLDSAVSSAFGRAPFFIFVDVADSEIKNWEAVPNPGMNADRGAGIVSANTVAGKGIDAVVSGSFGPNAYTLLSQANIKIYTSSAMRVGEAAIKAANGELSTGAVAPSGAGFGRGQGFGRGMGRGFGRGAGRGMGRGRGGGMGRWNW